MLIIVHSLWGLMLATQTKNVFLLLLGGVGGHILLDVIPHRDLTTVKQVIVDLFSATAISLFLIRIYSLPMTFIWAVLFSTLPDIDVALTYYGLYKQACFPSHFPSWHGVIRSSPGMLMNFLVGSVLLFIFFLEK